MLHRQKLPPVFLLWALVLVIGSGATWVWRNAGSIQAQTPAEGVTVEGKISLIPEADYNRPGEIDAGDTVALIIQISNTGNQDYTLAALSTGIDASLIHDFWNLRGADSLTEENGTLVFKNLRVPANASTVVAVEATVDYFTEGQLHLQLTPELRSSDGQLISTVIPNNESSIDAGPWAGDLPWWIYDPPTSSPTPTPTPSVTPSPTIEPSATPSPIPSPSVTPDVSPTPTSTPTPTGTPSPSVTPSPTPTPTSSPTSSFTPSPTP